MQNNEKELKKILTVLHEQGMLDNVILIGSWCLFFYNYIFNNFEPTVRTTDIDFYIPDVKAIKEGKGIVQSFKEINYEIIHDCLTSKSFFISPDGFELEFLTKLSRNQMSCIKVGNTGIYAESLPFLDIFTGHYIEVKLFDMNIKVASPASYVLQKLLINDKRSTEKAEKDLLSIKEVMFYINASYKFKCDLVDLFNDLPKKWKTKIMKTAALNNIPDFERL